MADMKAMMRESAKAKREMEEMQVDGWTVGQWMDYFASYSNREWAVYVVNGGGGQGWSVEEWRLYFHENGSNDLAGTLAYLGMPALADLVRESVMIEDEAMEVAA